jgi:hypothetical protein
MLVNSDKGPIDGKTAARLDASLIEMFHTACHGSQEGDDVELTRQMVLHLLTICYFYVIGLQRPDACYPLPGRRTLRKCNAVAGDSPFR